MGKTVSFIIVGCPSLSHVPMFGLIPVPPDFHRTLSDSPFRSLNRANGSSDPTHSPSATVRENDSESLATRRSVDVERLC